MGTPQIVFGTCDGTGAAINVCLGFIPRYVKVWNMEDGGSKMPEIEWTKQMSLISAMDEGVKDAGISDTDFDRTIMSSAGISAYAGGDKMRYDANTSKAWEVLTAFPSGASVEEVYVDGAYERAATTDAAYRCIGDVIAPEKVHGTIVTAPAGFTIGADGDINTDGEQLAWMAIR